MQFWPRNAFSEKIALFVMSTGSDVNEGCFMDAATVACLHADSTFLPDLEAVPAEDANYLGIK